jgi:glutaredoxin-related protein
LKEFLSLNGIEFEYIDITDSMRNLKSFLKLRDKHEAFEFVRNRSGVGIPALLVDGKIILNITEAIVESLKA